MSLKVQKIRSLENAVYKDSYNRMRFQISADDMSTDMSESYLAFKLYIVNGLTGKAYTAEEILNLDKSKVMFSFGSSLGEAYSPACLIKTARLFSMMGEMTLLEEINYCNVITQTLNQFVKDFESLSSESLMTMASTGSLMMSSVGSGVGSYFGAELSLADQSVQVNIKLQDIFGVCKTNNFHLSMTNGLMVELELEDTHSLIQQRVASDFIAVPPATLGDSIGFIYDYSTNPKCIRATNQNLYSNSANELATSNGFIVKPEFFKYDSNDYVEYFIPSATVDTSALVKDSYYQIQNLNFPTLTVADWTAMGAPPGPDGPDVDTADLQVGTIYTVKNAGALTVPQWLTAGAYTNNGDDVLTDALVVNNAYIVTQVGTLTTIQWASIGLLKSANDNISTDAIVNAVSYQIVNIGTVNILQWATIGYVNSAGDNIATTNLTQNNYYQIVTLGTLSLADWNTAGWVGTALPVVGDVFQCAAVVPGSDGVCNTLIAPVNGNYFVGGAAVAGTDAVVNTLNAPAVNDIFIATGNIAATDGHCSTLGVPTVGNVFQALAATVAGGTVYVAGSQSVGQQFKALAPGPAGGVCYQVDANGKMIEKAGQASNTIQFKSSFQWTVAQMAELDMVVGKTIRVMFKISQPNKVDRFFQHMTTINTVVGQALPLGPQLVLNDFYIIPDFTGTHLQNAKVTFSHFELVSQGLELNVNTDSTAWETFQTTSTLSMTEAQIQNLQAGGILSAGTVAQITAGSIKHLSGTSGMVCIAVDQSINNDVSIYPDIYENADIPSLRRLYSNQSVRLPNQGGVAVIEKAVYNATTQLFDVTFDNLGLENNNSIQNASMLVPGGRGAVTPGLGVITPANSFNIHIWNAKTPNATQAGSEMVVGQSYMITDIGTTTQAQWVAAGNDNVAPVVGQSFVCVQPLVGDGLVTWIFNNRTHNSFKNPTWEITKAELVLIQTEKDGMPPASIYSTVKVEAVTIENILESYNRQFIISEPNCYSALLCAPLPSTSLVSHSRNIQQYRWSINNIDNTNRNIVIQSNSSKYPSTLHLDKFLDTMNNDVAPVASLSGINGVARSGSAPVVFPLKIYSSSDAESQYLNPLSNYTVQFAAYGDSTHNQNIVPGPVYLFKYMFKTL